jgi:hypothetical protein
MNPDQLIREMMLTFPLSKCDRITCLVDAFGSSECYWTTSGELESEFDYAGYRADHPVLLDARAIYDQRIEKFKADRLATLQSGYQLSEREASEVFAPVDFWKHDIELEMAFDTYNVNSRVYNNLEELATTQGVPKFLRDFSYGSNLLSMPDNVTDEWLAAAEEVCHALETAPYGSYANDPRLQDTEPISKERYLQQYRAAAQVLGNKEDLSDEALNARYDVWQAELEVEREQLHVADAGVVATNRKHGAAARARIEEIKSSRVQS